MIAEQKKLEKAWAKMELNSIYGFPPVASSEYNSESAKKITESGNDQIKALQKLFS